MGLNYFPEPSGQELEVRKGIRAIVDKHVRPYAIEDDVKSYFRNEAYQAIASQGYAAIVTPKEYGGLGLPFGCYYACMEEIARASLAMAVTVSVNNLPQGALLAFGTEEQKKEFLPPLTSGEQIGAFSLSEPGSGSDAAGLMTSAKKVDDGYVLNGTKCWCSTAGYADLYLVMARTDSHKTKGISSFLVSKDTKGFRIGKQEKKLGLCASPLGELIFEDCFIPQSRLLGSEGEGFKVALSQLDSGRIVIGATGLGVSIEALERAWNFIAKQRTNGEFIVPGIEGRLAEHYASIQSLKTLLALAARNKDQGENVTILASQVKLLGSDLAMRVTTDATQAMGPSGVLREFEVERLMRDAKALQIVEGTNQIQRLVLAREMEKAVLA